MKWETAINKIEKAMDEGKKVTIEYHRKWMKQDSHFDVVYSINEYDWHGNVCKAVTTYHDGLDEDSHIIDNVIIEA